MALGFDVSGSGSGSTGTVVPDKGMTVQNAPNIKRSNFGDGYVQRLPNGINNDRETYNVVFATRPKQEIDDIYAFLEDKGGTDNFTFTVPDENAVSDEKDITVVCVSWSKSWDYDNFYTLTAVFEEDFAP